VKLSLKQLLYYKIDICFKLTIYIYVWKYLIKYIKYDIIIIINCELLVNDKL